MESKTVPGRIAALYGNPGFETWEKVGAALKLSRGSAWSLAHGLKRPDAQVLKWLECVEFRDKLPKATEKLCYLAGQNPVMTVSLVARRARRNHANAHRKGE